MKLFLQAILLSVPLTLMATDEAMRAEVAQASKALTQRQNYTWVSTSKSAEGTVTWRQGPTHGYTQKEGPTYIKFQLGDNLIELAFQSGKSAIRWEDRWRSSGDLAGDVAWIADRLKAYLFAAQEAAFLAEHSHRFNRDDDGWVRAELKPAAITALLSRGRRQVAEAPEMNGTIRYWIKDKELSKYEYTLRGQMPASEGGEVNTMDRTTVVEIKEIDQTRVELPQEGRKALQ